MHLALPSRKSSNPSPYVNRSGRFPMLRRSRVQAIALGACAVGVVIFILSQILGGGDSIPSGTPPVVIVTVLDHEKYGKEYIENVRENRIQYAAKHGYATFFPTIKDYELAGAPDTWARVPATRHAFTKFPYTTFVWFLDQNSLIMNPAKTIEHSIMDARKLEGMLLKNQPIVPPDSVIKTFPNLKGTNIDLVLTQDKEGLSQGSFIVRRGEWSKFFLDTWFDPLYRSYNFQKADTHALEHIVQWHPTILSKMALVPQRTMNAYNKVGTTSESSTNYVDGDFVIRFPKCEETGRDCAKESQPFENQWKTTFRKG